MDTAIVVALIMGGCTGVPATIAATLGFINQRSLLRHGLALQHQSLDLAETHQTVVDTRAAVVVIEKQTNSITEALVKATGEAALARGKLEGAKTQQEKEEKV